ncbi:hypothetical protein PC121_g24745 [Phytophthora cactorum]|nr:hypothetical protein PC121_g24745 [Phytophthora cactorum]
MGRGKALSEQEHWWIVGLHDGGVPLREISRKTGRSRTCVRKAIKEEREPRTDETAKGDCFAKELKTRFGIKASVRTIQRLLKSVDHLVYTKMDRTLPLTAAHKTTRMDWAEEHILKPDEKMFNLDGPDGFKYYWRGMRRPAQSYVRRQDGEGSVMVWGTFSAAGKSKLAILCGRQNSAR